MAEFKQIIDDALDILKFDGAVQDTLAELREKWGAQVPALLDERFDAVGVQYMKLSHEKGAAALGVPSQGQLRILRIGRCCEGSTCQFLYALFVVLMFPTTPMSV